MELEKFSNFRSKKVYKAVDEDHFFLVIENVGQKL
jgi:hypothetical protein